MSPRDLPNDRERALEAIAAGYGREATAAHPDCRCGRPYTPTCPHCQAKPNQPCRQSTDDKAFDLDTRVNGRHRYRPATRTGTRRDCPIHRGAR